jgi:hypothetical protein
LIAPTFSIWALTMFALPSEQTGDAVDRNPVLDIDACVEVDDASVENLVDLELRDARRGERDAPISVGVRCLEDAQEIRVEPWASQGADGIRTIALPAADDADPAAREARSRELALAIAELIRRLEITRPLHPRPQPPPPPPPVPVIVSTPPTAEEPRGRWQLAALSSFEAFTGGQKLAGGDIAVAVAIGRLLLTEVRLGGRLVDAETPPLARLTGRAGTAALAAGPNVWSRQRTVGFALMLRAQGYAIEYRAESPGEGGSRTSRLGALTVAVEPRLLVALSPRISLAAAVGVGVPLHGIVVRAQGTETDSLTGVVVCANLGAALTF